MNSNTGVFLQISDVFGHVSICEHDTCGHVVYSNDKARGRTTVLDHGLAVHQTRVKVTEMTSQEYISANINIGVEEVDDLDLAQAEVMVESLEIAGYTCGVDTCSKTVDVSRTVNSTVAINRLKNHFLKMHKELDSSLFSYETRYNKDVENAVNVSIEMPSPVKTNVEEPRDVIIVYQCQELIKKGRQCPELAMDSDSLRIHWGSQHTVAGTKFEPLQLSIESVSHYQCPVSGCWFRHLRPGQVKQHWEHEHSDHPDKFQVIHNKVRILTPQSVNTIMSPSSAKKTPETKKRFRLSSSKSSTPTAAKKPKLDHEDSIISKKQKVECDVSANFDISCYSSISTGESDSDFEMEYTLM